MTTGEHEVVRSFFQPAEIVVVGDVPTEDVAEYFWRERGDVQQCVPSASELDYDLLVLYDLLLQGLDRFDVDLAAQPVSNRVRSWYTVHSLTHIDSGVRL